jgi:hypothetical protein
VALKAMGLNLMNLSADGCAVANWNLGTISALLENRRKPR